MNKKNILNFAKHVVRNNGSFSTVDCEKYGIPFEFFLQLSLLSTKNLLENCNKIIKKG